MSVPSSTYRVGLATAAGVSAEALSPTAEALREFGVETEVFSGGDGLTLVGEMAARWCAVVVASDTGELPAAVAARVKIPVIRVPTESAARGKLDLLVAPDGNLPGGNEGAPFATVAIGAAGAKNAALFVISLLALDDDRLRDLWEHFRTAQTEAVLRQPPPVLE